MLNASILRPGLMVHLATTVTGNVRYRKQTIEGNHITSAGTAKEVWETERTVFDPIEHEASVKARTAARTAITSICTASTFCGLLCRKDRRDTLEQAIAESRAIADRFNATARLTRLNVYITVGEIADDDVAAVRSINAEVSGLIATMESGLRNLDSTQVKESVKQIRDAANKARDVARMLEPKAAEQIQGAIDLARSAARKIIAAGESAAVEIDNATLARLAEARTAFLDLDGGIEVQIPQAESRPLDLEQAMDDARNDRPPNPEIIAQMTESEKLARILVVPTANLDME